MNGKRIWLISAAIVAVVLALILSRISCQGDEPTAGRVVRNTSARPRGPASVPGQLKVGVYLSQHTAEQIDGYSCQMTDQLLHRGLDVIPLLEPGGEKDERVQKLLTVYFGGRAPIDVTNAEALKKLDVIVAPRIWFLPDEARAAIEQAVTNGTGLLARNGLGSMEPGDAPETARLSGFESGRFGYNAHPMECEVIASHPILGNLKIGQTFSITPNGTWGKPLGQTIPLIKVKDMDAFRDFGMQGDDDWMMYPLYVSQLGKGRIVGCQFPAWEPTPKDLMAATGGEFNLRCVLWLAHRLPGDTSSSTTTVSTRP